MSTATLTKTPSALAVALAIVQTRAKFEKKLYLPSVPNARVHFDSNGNLVASTNPENFIVKTTTYTAKTGDRIAADTSGGVFTITLPATPTAGDRVQIIDASATFDSNNLTVARNGSKINSASSNYTASTENGNYEFVYIDATIGWKVLIAATATGSTAITGTLSVSGLTTLTGGAATGGKIYPSTDDGAALGDTTHHFSDLFLATGAVLNFNNGNVAVTHSSGVLTVGTGDLRVTNAGTNAASVTTVGGTQTLTNKTLTSPVVNGPTGTGATEVVTATNVIAATESGTTFFLNSATEFVSTLPAPAAGLKFKFIVSAAPSGASYTIVTNSSANIIKGTIVTAATGAADTETSGGDTISFVDGQAVAGDQVELECDGTNWFVRGICSVAAGITITTAS